MSETLNTQQVEMSQLTTQDFLKGLSERVSGDNARLLLNSALVRVGLQGNGATAFLPKEDAITLCLELIRAGGPAFQVGQALYRQVH